ncbi:hypothetical protein Tco_1269851 [Tanacetum coccineum]
MFSLKCPETSSLQVVSERVDLRRWQTKPRKKGTSESTVVDENWGRCNKRSNPPRRTDRLRRCAKVWIGEWQFLSQPGEFEDSKYVHGQDHKVVGEELEEEIFTTHQSIEDLQADVALSKRFVASGGVN